MAGNLGMPHIQSLPVHQEAVEVPADAKEQLKLRGQNRHRHRSRNLRDFAQPMVAELHDLGVHSHHAGDALVSAAKELRRLVVEGADAKASYHDRQIHFLAQLQYGEERDRLHLALLRTVLA